MRSATAIVVAGWLFLASGCMFERLNEDLERADATYHVLKVAGIEATTPDGLIHVVLYRVDGSEPRLINVRSPEPGVPAMFLVRSGDYTVVAFEDLNEDYRYQQGEPSGMSDEPPLYPVEATQDHEPREDGRPGLHLRLSDEQTVPFEIDLTLAATSDVIVYGKRHYLTVTTWDNPAFTRENSEKGLWQPVTFLEETGFGLYLLEPLDPQKQPVLFVHGMVGSPLDFKWLAGSLDRRYQVLLYHYPTGIPLDHSSYILQSATRNFLNRFSYPSIHVIAHSMGGLVARDMIVSVDEASAARIDKFITLSTPWSGHEAARAGLTWAPTVAPAWRSMVPNSQYLRHSFSRPLPALVEHHLFFTFAHARGGPSESDDGVVTIKSQLRYQAQIEASSLHGVDDSHVGVLTNRCVESTIGSLLKGGTGEPAPSDVSCIAPVPQ